VSEADDIEVMDLTLGPETEAGSLEGSIDPEPRRDASTMTCLLTFKVALRSDASVATELPPVQRASEKTTANMAGNVISPSKLDL
jgi:hypothetical protein